MVVVCAGAGEAVGRQMEALAALSAAAQRLGLPHLVVFAADPAVRVGIDIILEPFVIMFWWFDHYLHHNQTAITNNSSYSSNFTNMFRFFLTRKALIRKWIPTSNS